MNWLQLRFHAAGVHTDQISAVLEAAGAVAVSVLAADDEALLEPGPGELPMWQHNWVCGLFPGGHDEQLLRLSLDNELRDLVDGEAESERIEDQDWINAWRDQAVAREFSNHLWVIPSDGEAPSQARAVVRLDAGLAFGSGAHPTTALCLEWLAQADLSDTLVLDYGCGSGILAIAAAALGARQVIAVDYDPQALTATHNNALLNGVAEKIHICAPGDVPSVKADYLLANILANALYSLCETLSEMSRPGAGLALSGILKPQAQRLLDRYTQSFMMDTPHQQADWLLLSGVRRKDSEFE